MRFSVFGQSDGLPPESVSVEVGNLCEVNLVELTVLVNIVLAHQDELLAVVLDGVTLYQIPHLFVGCFAYHALQKEIVEIVESDAAADFLAEIEQFKV